MLPVGLYSSMYATCNARSLMNFLSCAPSASGRTFPSFPQREIEMVAEQMEAAVGRVDAAHSRRLREERSCRALTRVIPAVG